MSVTASLIGEDAALSITLGGPWDGSLTPLPIGGAIEPTGAAVNILGICKSISHHETVKTTNVKALGDSREKHRYHSFSGEIMIEAFTPATGYVLPFNKVGSYIGVTFDPNSVLVTPETYTGVIIDWKLQTATDGTPTTVSITIDLNPAV